MLSTSFRCLAQKLQMLQPHALNSLQGDSQKTVGKYYSRKALGGLRGANQHQSLAEQFCSVLTDRGSRSSISVPCRSPRLGLQISTGVKLCVLKAANSYRNEFPSAAKNVEPWRLRRQ